VFFCFLFFALSSQDVLNTKLHLFKIKIEEKK